MIDKQKSAAVMQRLREMSREFDSQWSQYTSGDKDLWHIAWILHGQDFTYVPYVGALGAFCESDRKFCMTAQVNPALLHITPLSVRLSTGWPPLQYQGIDLLRIHRSPLYAILALARAYVHIQAKFDLNGDSVVTHQLWRDGSMPKPNFHGVEWPALTPELGGRVRYNPPDLTLRYDLRQNKNFRYARVGSKYPESQRASFKPGTDWDHITKDPKFGPDNMYVALLPYFLRSLDSCRLLSYLHSSF